jgi:hypothetical protein
MKLEKRIDILTLLGNYLLTDSPGYSEARERAFHENKWFLPSYTLGAGKNIARAMLQRDILSAFSKKYLAQNEAIDKRIGIVMAGNIPFVGMHDIICTFLFGCKASVKLSSKDTVLFKHLIDILGATHTAFGEYVTIEERLNGCDAYIATGSNNSARYFEHYFGKYPHIIRKNKTSVAILEGNESKEELNALADDIQLYFGLGCRNVTQLYVPKHYDFIPLLDALRKYDHYREHDKYKNNFDYQLTIAIMNNVYYMSNDSIVLIENPQPFSPISQLHYQFYDDKKSIQDRLDLEKVQCIVGRGFTPFGEAQTPNIDDFADGIDTMEFLQRLA